MGNWSGKVVVVTGGNSGIGKAIAERFVKEGARVAILGRDPKKLADVKKQLELEVAVQGDVSKIHDLERLYSEVKRLGKIDLLVANAGIASMRPLKDVDESFFDEIVAINYKGVYFTVQRALPHLNKPSSVVLISSCVAHMGWPGHSVYSSTKAAVSYLARSFAAELVQHGVRVNAISPGFIETPIFDRFKKEDPDILKKFATNVPQGRFGGPEEIADAVAFLGSSEASYITGIDLVIDGGLVATSRVNA